MDPSLHDGLRAQQLEGLPARVQGMAEALILEWAHAVEAVPQLASTATSEIIGLLRLSPAERETALRRRWGQALGDGSDPSALQPSRRWFGSGLSA